MIVAVKRESKKPFIVKVIVGLSLVGMFTAYYFHMGDKFTEDKEVTKEVQKPVIIDKKAQRATVIERIIYKEAEIAIDLIGQKNIQSVKIFGNKLLIICDINTNLDAIKVRYGVLALIANSMNDIKIALDLKQIVESKYNEEK